MKIGISDDPDRRCKQLQTGHPERLQVYHRESVELETASIIERFIHNDLRPWRLAGEWFRLDSEQAIAEVKFGLIRWDGSPELLREARKKNHFSKRKKIASIRKKP